MTTTSGPTGANEIIYCDQCTRMIRPAMDTRAIVTAGHAVCGACAAQLPPEALESLRREAQPDSAHALAERPGRAAGSHRQKKLPLHATGGGERSRAILIAAPAAGLVVGLIAAVVILSGGTAAPPPPVQNASQPAIVALPVALPATSVRNQAPPSANEARRELDRIRAASGRSLDSYGEWRSALQAMIEKYPGTSQAAEARSVMDDIDARYAKLAGDELEAALSATRELIANRRFDTARSILRSVKDRYGEGLWYESTGRARMDEAFAAIDRAEAAPAPQPAETTAASGANLIRNGSMTAGGTMPDRWGKYGEPAVDRDTEVFRSAPASLRATSPASGAKAQGIQGVEDPPQGQIRVTGYIRGENPVKAQTAVQFFSEDWNRNDWVQVQYVQGETDWIEFSKVLTVPAWAKRFNFVLLAEGGGRAWIDDVAVVSIPTGAE